MSTTSPQSLHSRDQPQTTKYVCIRQRRGCAPGPAICGFLFAAVSLTISLNVCGAAEQSPPVPKWQQRGVLRAFGDPNPKTLLAAELSGGLVPQRLLASAKGMSSKDSDYKAATDELEHGLQDKDPEVRSAAAQALGQLDDKAAVPELVKLLQDQAPIVRSAAAQALVQLGDKAAVPELVKLLQDQASDVRSAAAQALGQLDDKAAVPELVKLLKDQASFVRSAAAQALVQLGDKAAVPEFVKLLKDQDLFVRSAAAQALGQLGDKAAVPELVKLLQEQASDVRIAAAQALVELGPLGIGAMPGVLARAYDSAGDIGFIRLYAHLLAGGQHDGEVAIGCLGKNAAESCNLKALTPDQVHDYLDVFQKLWNSSADYPDVREDLAGKVGYLATHGNWPDSDLTALKSFQAEFSKDTSYDGDTSLVKDSMLAREHWKWFKAAAKLWGGHALFWAALICFYPRSTKVQAFFFWNPWARRILGLGYVGFLLTWVPFLRHILLAPFHDPLLADADLENYDSGAYFSQCSVVLRPKGKPQPILKAIPRVRGEVVLEGESGLGKTMFLRGLAKDTRKRMAFLPAQRCAGGVIEAIQYKLLGYAQDEAFLKSLVYSGGIDVVIDGLNEVSPDTRARVSTFVENFFRANVIVGTQPLEWTAPKTARVYALQPLTPEQIEAFLLSREYSLPADAVLKGNHYEEACRTYLSRVLNPDSKDDPKESVLQMLSNPMDLTVVAEMLARGEQPDLFHLRAQQYTVMADDYKRANVSQEFPLKAFSEHCYDLRLKDEVAISEERFWKELPCMERHKLVVRRESVGPGGVPKTEWLFRHDKIIEFFIAQTFLVPDSDRPQKHIGDPRFSGVYYLLATLLPIDQAAVLRERLIDYAAESKDHTVSDNFVQILRLRKGDGASVPFEA